MALTKTQVSELYTAIFNRASEGDGNAYWAGLNASAATIAQGMLDTTDAATYFGTSLATNQAFVEHIYLNTLNKTVAQDATGIAYWVDLLDAGHTRGEVVSGLVSAVADYATSTDATTLAAYNQFTNRVAVSDYTADTLATAPSDYATSTSFSSGLTVTDAIGTVTTAKAAVVVTHDANVTPTYTIASDVASVTEGGNVVFTVTASAALLNSATTLNYQIAGVEVAGGTATPASDLGKVTGEITIAAGATTGTMTLIPTDDGVTEGYEGFKVSILDSSFATVATSSNVVIKDGAESGQNFALTTGTDTGGAFTGTSGNDTFTGVVGTTSTLTAGDTLNGGAGTDALNISYTEAGAAQSVAGIVLSTIETINISNYTTTQAESLNLAQATGVTSINTTGTSTNGNTTVTNIAAVVNTTLANGTTALTLTYADTAVVGTADSSTLTLNAQTAGTFTVAGATTGGIETLNVVSSTSANTITVADTNNAMKTMNISGDQNLTITNNGTALTTIDASTATGNVLVSTTTATVLTATGGAGDDTVTFAADNFTLLDTVDGGAGTDTLLLAADAAIANTDFAKVTNVEIIQATLDNSVITMAANVSATTFDLTNAAVADTKQTLNLNAGYTNATTVNIDTDVDTIVNTAADVVLTVNGTDAAFATAAIAGADATGVVNTANIKAASEGGTAVTLSSTGVITNIDTITIVDGGDTATAAPITGDILGRDISITTGAYATALTIDGSALDAGTLATGGLTMNADDETLTVLGTGATKVLTITGGAGRDIITTGNANDIVDGGAGNDTITASAASNLTIQGGAGDDSIVMGATLTSADIIDGGEGTDTLQVTSITATALAGVTNVESLAVTGASTVSLSSNLSFTAIDISDASTQSLTFGTGYTNATTVYLKTDAGDTVVNTAKVALTVDATLATAITGSTLTGGAATTTNGVTTGNTDALVITAGGSITADSIASSATATFGTTVTNFDSLTVRKGVDAGDDIVIALDAYTTNMTIDASALTDAGTMNAAGTATNGDDSTLTLTATSTANLNITGGAGWDSLTLSGTANHTINTGAGNDSINLAGTLTNADTINGGDGTDTLSVNAGTTDVNYLAVSNVENLALLTTGTTTLSSYATIAGITKVTGLATDVNTINAAGMTSAIEMVGATTTNKGDVFTGGTGNDTFTFSGTTGLQDDTATNGDRIDGGTGTDTVSLDNSIAAGGAVTATATVGVASAAETIYGVENFTVKNANGGDTAGSENADVISLTLKSAADNATDDADQTITLDASIITDTNDTVTLDASGVLDTDILFTIKAGASASTLSGGAAADTITGGAAIDTITGGIGADTLTGGAAGDLFKYASTTDLASIVNAGASTHSTSAAADTIVDFISGTDKIVLTATLADGAANTFKATDKGDATSLSNGTALLTADENGQYFYNTTDKQLVVDMDGNGLIQASDLVINMTGQTGFASSDMTVVVTGGDNVDTITTGAGNDYLSGGTGGDAETLTGGAGNDTYVVADMGAVDNFVEAASGGTNDTILVTNLDISTLKVNGAAAAINGASGLGIEQIVLGNGATTLIGAQLSGLTVNLAEIATGSTGSIVVTATTGATTNLSNLTFTASTYTDATGASVASTAFNGAITVNGTDGAINTLIGTSIADTLVGGTGNFVDQMTGGLGADIYTVSGASTSVDIVNIAAGDTVLTIAGTGNAGTIAGYDVINGGAALVGDATNNSFNLNVAGTGVKLSAGAVDGSNSTLTIAGATLKSHSVSAAGLVTFDDAETYAGAVATTTAAMVAAAVEYLQANDLGDTGASALFAYDADTFYVYTQGSDAGTDNTLDTLVEINGDAIASILAVNAATDDGLFIS